MKELGSTSVGTLGISLGASSVLGAAHAEGATGRSTEASSRSHRRPIPTGLGAAFRAGAARAPPLPAPLRLPGGAHIPGSLGALAAGGRGHDEGDGSRLRSLLRGRCGRDLATGTGIDHIAEVEVPLLVLHPEDDQIVKVEHARILADAARDNEARPGLGPPRRAPRDPRGDRPDLDLSRLPRLLRTVGSLRRARGGSGRSRGRGGLLRPRSGLTRLWTQRTTTSSAG